METTEIIAELRKVVAVGDSPVFCGGSFIPKLVAMEAADALERQQQRLRDLSELVIRQGDEYAKLRRESEPVVHAHWDKERNCSNCGAPAIRHDLDKEVEMIYLTRRCPECGAHMDEEVADA